MIDLIILGGLNLFLFLFIFGLAYYICKDDNFYKRHSDLKLVYTGFLFKEDKDIAYILDISEERMQQIREKLKKDNKSKKASPFVKN